MGYVNLFFSGKMANNTLDRFQTMLREELNWSLLPSGTIPSKVVDFADYKFFVVDNAGHAQEFARMDEKFFAALMASLRNLVIVGKNFDFPALQKHELYQDWFAEHSIRI